MTVQTTIAAGTGGSLITFLLAYPSTQQAQIFYALLIGAVFGMLVNYLRRWLAEEISGSLVDYMFRQNPRRTMLAVFGIVSWCAGEVASGLFVTGGGEFIGWGLVILSGLKTGYAGDSLINKGGRTVWTEERRAAVQASQLAPAPTEAAQKGTRP